MSTPLRRDDTVIGRLRVRGSGAASTQLQQAIAAASWPTLADDSWVFIRSLHGKATTQAMVPALLQQTRQLLSSPGSNQQLQRFADLSDLLAHLLVDLARGQASQHWYWQQWQALFSLPASTALRRLLLEHQQQWPRITAQLHRQQTLATVWHCLTESDAGQMLAELCWTLGVSARDTAIDIDTAASLPRPPIMLAQRWQLVLQPLPESDARRMLAFAIMAQEFAPLVLRQVGVRWLAHLDRTTSMRNSRMTSVDEQMPPAQQRAAVTASTPLAIDNAANTRSSLGSKRATAITPEPETEDLTRSGIVPRREQSPVESVIALAPTHERAASSINPSATPQPSAVVTPPSQHPTDAVKHNAKSVSVPRARAHTEVTAPRWQQSNSEPEVAFDQFQTRFGGLLFLLNFLNRSEPQQLMARHWQLLPNAWCWLFRLGELLQLDLTDPIADFIANQAGLGNVDALSQTPALPAAAELVALADRWYQPTELWQPSLLRLDAEVRFSASHCDLHAKLEQVRLPLRLAGLDINPGWLPWLGRVVTFHYH